MSTPSGSQVTSDDADGRALPQYLSFHVRRGKWETGEVLRQQLAKELAERGWAIDLEAGRDDPDWFFLATRGEESVGVVLACGRTPVNLFWRIVRRTASAFSDKRTRVARAMRLITHHARWLRWYVSLEAVGQNRLVSAKLREEINPALEEAISKWRGATSLRWHADHTTLSQM